MITTSQEWKDRIYEKRSALLLRAKLILNDGSILYLDHEDGDDDFLSTGISFDDNTTPENTFAIGSAIMNSFSFKLNNAGGKYDTILFQNAEIYPEIGMNIDGTVEWLKKGVFVVTDPGGRGNAITFTTFDRMSKMHLPFSGVNVSYPITIGALAQAICDYCGVELASIKFNNCDYLIPSAPVKTSCNCRQMISYIAQLAASYARFNNEGKLAFSWYGTEAAEISVYKSLDIDLFDTAITGIKVTSYYSDSAYSEEIEGGEVTESTLYGEEGYVLSIAENPLVQYGQSSIIAKLIGPVMCSVGPSGVEPLIKFRSLDLVTFYDPSLEAGDMIRVTDAKGNTYVSYITNLSVNFGGYMRISCGAETAEENAVSSNYTGNQAVIQSMEVANAKFKNLIAVHLEAEVAKFGYVTADDVEAVYAKIDNLKALEGEFDDLKTNTITADNLSAKVADLGYATVENLNALSGKIDDLSANVITTDNLSAEVADLGYATIDNLDALSGKIDDLSAIAITTENLSTKVAEIDFLDVTSANARFASIDFSNIGQAAMEHFYAQSGLIENVVIKDGVITGEIVGVTIKGDLIEGGTVIADKLVMLGEDGLYYKLNVDGGATVSEEVTEEQLQNGLSGSVIIAKTITADKVSVSDLVAFDATIGGFKITENAIHSAVKESVDNTTRGIYMDNDGQFSVGDASNYFKYYKDENGDYKLEISIKGNDINDIEIGARNLIRNSTSMIYADYCFGIQPITVIDDGNGNITIVGLTATHDGNETVTIIGATATHDGNETVTITR